jgi:hypothetical protein
MRARHTQALAGFRAVASKTLVNRARMKVVNIALTKFSPLWPGLTQPFHLL